MLFEIYTGYYFLVKPVPSIKGDPRNKRQQGASPPAPLNPRLLCVRNRLTGPKPKGIKVQTFRIDYLIRTPKVEKLSLQPISIVGSEGSMLRG